MNDDVLRRLRADLNELRITTLQILHQVDQMAAAITAEQTKPQIAAVPSSASSVASTTTIVSVPHFGQKKKLPIKDAVAVTLSPSVSPPTPPPLRKKIVTLDDDDDVGWVSTKKPRIESEPQMEGPFRIYCAGAARHTWAVRTFIPSANQLVCLNGMCSDEQLSQSASLFAAIIAAALGFHHHRPEIVCDNEYVYANAVIFQHGDMDNVQTTVASDDQMWIILRQIIAHRLRNGLPPFVWLHEPEPLTFKLALEAGTKSGARPRTMLDAWPSSQLGGFSLNYFIDCVN